jgi:hypothetical protein
MRSGDSMAKASAAAIMRNQPRLCNFWPQRIELPIQGALSSATPRGPISSATSVNKTTIFCCALGTSRIAMGDGRTYARHVWPRPLYCFLTNPTPALENQRRCDKVTDMKKIGKPIKRKGGKKC